MKPVTIRQFGLLDYQETWQAMKQFIGTTNATIFEEIWLLQHPPVYTLGQAGKREHLLQQTNIPIINSDRGGQITYHGPGQVIAYIMINLKQRPYGLRHLVRRLEQSIITVLDEYNIIGVGDIKAPGVYVNGDKIAALGLRVSHGWTYHGIGLNVKMDLSPYNNINPCGYPGLKVTQIANHYPDVCLNDVALKLAKQLQEQL